MFKNNWEKTEVNYQVDEQTIKRMIHNVYPDEVISSHAIISGGCANFNIKFTLIDHKPLLLRIYIRDKDAAYKEQKIADLIGQSVPVPKVYFIGDVDVYRYAITEYMDGITLRDFLLEHPDHQDMSAIMYECGKMLTSIARYTFDKPGFFDNNLHVKSSAPDNPIAFIEECLQHQIVIEQLGQKTIDDIHKLVKKYAANFPDAQEAHLVHNDYDPANILMHQQNGQWKISAVLDFEFAFSGSWLWDVSNMLRYAHKMPVEFKSSFLKGITDSGFIMPYQWNTTINLLNLTSLLDCLSRCSVEEKPNQSKDICELIDHILKELIKE